MTIPALLADLVPGITAQTDAVTKPPAGPNLPLADRTANYPFDVWTYADANQALKSTVESFAGGRQAFLDNLRFAELQDHWQGGAGWVGPDGGSDLAVRTRVLEGVRRQFTPVDVIGEALDRVVDGVLEREATVEFIARDTAIDPESTEGQQLAADAEAMLALVSAWWDRVRLWESARAATRRSRWSGRGVLRVWMPTASLELDSENTPRLPTNLTPADAFARLALQSPFPGTAACYLDEETQRTCAIFRYREGDASCAEVWYVDRTAAAAAPMVMLRQLRDAGESTDYPMPLAGHLPFAEMQAPLLVTEPVRRQQKRLNFLESIVTRTGETAGFPERYTLNAEPAGAYFDTAPSDGPALAEVEDADGKRWYLHAMPRTLGAATTTDLRGIQTQQIDSSGASHQVIATPGVHIKEPTDPAFATHGASHARATILQSVRQAHVLDGGSDARSSGESQKQKRADHEKDLHKTAAPLTGMLRDTLTTVIQWAGQMMTTTGDTGRLATFLERFRVQVTVSISSGPVMAADRAENLKQVEGGAMPLDMALAANGVEDVQAAKEAILRDPRYLADLWAKRGVALQAMTSAGCGLVESAIALGVSEDDARALLAGDGTGDPTQNGGVTQ